MSRIMGLVALASVLFVAQIVIGELLKDHMRLIQVRQQLKDNGNPIEMDK